MRWWRLVAAAVLLAAAGVAVWLGRGFQDDKLVFRLLSETPKDGVGILVRNGLIVNAARDYPASFYAQYRKECSGTLIGRNTILISAHCLTDVEEVEVVGQLGRLQARCAKHPDFTATPEYDVALCMLLGDPPLSGGFERIARPPFSLGPSDEIRVTGWGRSHATFFGKWWTRVKFGLGMGGDFRVGKATGTDKGPAILALGEMTPEGRVALDHGDSGGAAYVGPDAMRRIVATNSCGGTTCGGLGKDTIGLASLVHDKTARFIEDWASNTGAHICGRDPLEDDGCHK